MYKIINEDNTWVKEYPSCEICKLINKKDKELMILFKEEIEKITIKEGYGKITVKVDYEGSILLNIFVMKNLKKRPFEENDKLFDKIIEHLNDFAKTEELLMFYNNSYIILE